MTKITGLAHAPVFTPTVVNVYNAKLFPFRW